VSLQRKTLGSEVADKKGVDKGRAWNDEGEARPHQGTPRAVFKTGTDVRDRSAEGRFYHAQRDSGPGAGADFSTSIVREEMGGRGQ
jgi:hypothetical protein